MMVRLKIDTAHMSLYYFVIILHTNNTTTNSSDNNDNNMQFLYYSINNKYHDSMRYACSCLRLGNEGN